TSLGTSPNSTPTAWPGGGSPPACTVTAAPPAPGRAARGRSCDRETSMMTRVAILVAAWLAGPGVAAVLADGLRYERRWVYASHNLLVDENVDRLIGLIERAAKAGYNGVVLADYKFNILDQMPGRYFRNVARVRTAASAAKVEIIPAIFPIGY